MFNLDVDFGTTTAGLDKLDSLTDKMKTGITLAATACADKLEEYAKPNAPWHDITGNARQGLKGRAGWISDTTIMVAICHTVDYGVYLELAHERKYSILESTMNRYSDDLFNQYTKILEGD